MTDANAVFEGLGRIYHARYGRLRPGKDEPAGSGRDSGDDDNCRQFSQWMKYEALDDAIGRIDELRAMLVQAKRNCSCPCGDCRTCDEIDQLLARS